MGKGKAKSSKRRRNSPKDVVSPSPTEVEFPKENVLPKSVLPTVSRFKAWCLGTILGLLFLSVLGNHISDAIPNVFQLVYKQVFSSELNKKQGVWCAALLKNEIEHDLNFSVWSYEQRTWLIDTLRAGETRKLVETGPIYVGINGDNIYETKPRIKFSQTYEGPEVYELESHTFDQEPSNVENGNLKMNYITDIIGGPFPKVLKFVDGTTVTFDLFGPTGIKLKQQLPVTVGGQPIYPFQQIDD